MVPQDEESEDNANADMDGNVIMFYMELHPKVLGGKKGA